MSAYLRPPAAGDPCNKVAIERKLAEDNARPIIFYNRNGTCEQPYVNGLTIMVNSIFNGWRMEDVWLDK
jgi:peptide/nickel transport system substrate-binding protein